MILTVTSLMISMSSMIPTPLSSQTLTRRPTRKPPPAKRRDLQSKRPLRMEVRTLRQSHRKKRRRKSRRKHLKKKRRKKPASPLRAPTRIRTRKRTKRRSESSDRGPEMTFQV